MKAANGGAPGGGGACKTFSISGPLNMVWIMMFCRMEIMVPNPDREMKIQAITVTKMERLFVLFTSIPIDVSVRPNT